MSTPSVVSSTSSCRPRRDRELVIMSVGLPFKFSDSPSRPFVTIEWTWLGDVDDLTVAPRSFVAVKTSTPLAHRPRLGTGSLCLSLSSVDIHCHRLSTLTPHVDLDCHALIDGPFNTRDDQGQGCLQLDNSRSTAASTLSTTKARLFFNVGFDLNHGLFWLLGFVADLDSTPKQHATVSFTRMRILLLVCSLTTDCLVTVNTSTLRARGCA
ncbi:hypothetical protein BDZ89DRAFT_1126659 [Hymenopellis radicata]|nr:hypothetical protein BDZ89DRAFT_1126659 [Hymenopellis radicata]